MDVVFKRREKRSWARATSDFFWPRTGWSRAAQYVKHRLTRLPDSPHRIARGIFCGVFVSFTPLYGLHFVASALLAMLIRGNVVAALLSTFFGNPITFPIIAAGSLRLGHWMLGSDGAEEGGERLGAKFSAAFGDLWHNMKAIFTPEVAHWGALKVFHSDVFLPYFVGGLIPGLIAGLIAYHLSLPLITAVQNRRKGMIKARIARLRNAANVGKKAGEI